MVMLQELFDLLASGEFSNISLSDEPTGGINEEEYPKVIQHINLGMVEIYKRFKFLENELTLHVDPAVSKYYLRPAYMALVDDLTSSAYIELGPGDEAVINIVEVTSVFDADGNELTMNNRFLTPAILQASDDCLKITGLELAQIYQVVYQAHPNKIVIENDFDPETYAVYIPQTIIEALLNYVAARVYKPIGSNDSTANADKSQIYQQQYELSMQKLHLYGLDPENNDDEGTFEEEGWA